MKCVNCGQEIPDNSQFCGYCGTKVEPKLSAKRFCPSCGKELKANAKFCTSCGASIAVSSANSFSHTNLNTYTVRQSNMNTSLISKQLMLGNSTFYVTELVGIICLFLGLLSLFLPYAGVNLLGSSVSYNLLSLGGGSDGIICLIVGIISLIFAFFHKPLVCMIGSILLTLTPVLEVTVTMENEYGGLVSFQIGFYLSLFVSLIGSVSFLLAYLEQRKMRKS